MYDIESEVRTEIFCSYLVPNGIYNQKFTFSVLMYSFRTRVQKCKH